MTIFPEDVDAVMEIVGAESCVQCITDVMIWFRAFIDKCSNSVLDVETLNAYQSINLLQLKFGEGKNKMMPYFENIKRVIIRTMIYPFVFTNSGSELSKIRECRWCGTYFLWKRLSATFCSAKCRWAFHHAENTN